MNRSASTDSSYALDQDPDHGQDIVMTSPRAWPSKIQMLISERIDPERDIVRYLVIVMDEALFDGARMMPGRDGDHPRLGRRLPRHDHEADGETLEAWFARKQAGYLTRRAPSRVASCPAIPGTVVNPTVLEADLRVGLNSTASKDR